MFYIRKGNKADCFMLWLCVFEGVSVDLYSNHGYRLRVAGRR